VKAILEKIPQAADRSFFVMDYAPRRFNCPFHYHPEYELTLIVSSTGQRYVGDHIARFAPGDLILMGPNLPHAFINDATFTGKAHSRVIQFLPDCLGAPFFRLGELKRVRELLERSRVGLVFRGRTRDRGAEMMGRLVSAQGVGRLVLFLELLELLGASRTYDRLASPGYSPSLAIYQGERINRVCDLIAKKFREDVTQSEAARLAGMSGPSFSRFFRRATNRTFRGFLNQVRIGHACQLLLETDRSVTEICYEAGFSNLSNFNRQFLRLRKTTPRDYRRKTAPLSGVPRPVRWKN
jgi:AraC-like DNA-binding protein